MSMMSEVAQRWSAFEPEFYRDGSLRDIYVLNTQLPHWAAAVDFVAERYALSFTGAWQGASLPRDIVRQTAP